MKIFSTLDEVADYLMSGKVGVIPTDTVYGLVARAHDEQAASKILEVKGRQYKPGTLIAASVEQLIELGIPARYLKPVEQYWPGAVSVVIPAGPELTYLHSGKGSLPVRIPDNKALLELLKKTGPLITTSANRPDQPTSTTIKEAQDYFGNSIDFYVDGGELTGRPPSTIIRIVDDAVEVLREGAVKINEAGEIVR